MAPKALYKMPEKDIALVRKHYDSTTESINKIIDLLDKRYPRWMIYKIAKQEGITKRSTARKWTPQEEAILERNLVRRNRDFLQRTLNRSWVSIKKKILRMRLKKNEIGLTKQQVLEIIGLKHRYLIDKWISSGKLHATVKHTDRTKDQHGDMYHIEPKHLRDFVINHYNDIDFNAVDKYLFVQCILGNL